MARLTYGQIFFGGVLALCCVLAPGGDAQEVQWCPPAGLTINATNSRGAYTSITKDADPSDRAVCVEALDGPRLRLAKGGSQALWPAFEQVMPVAAIPREHGRIEA
jgi:hypothetical protein